MPDYILKLKALLHDPVHKIWSFQNVKGEDIKHREVLHLNKKWHEKVALDLFKFILNDNLDDDKIYDADQISSALSRIVVAPNIENKEERRRFNEESNIPLNQPLFIDPFKISSEEIGNPSSHDEVKTVFKKIGNMDFKDDEERAKFAFLFLWR
ncbi:MAG: hypothetical protein N2166_06465, partial [candidate division WOR-3 bacterium]|nr:hypothetical protein [candidate division WOR-3 bacterium]